jgi:Domain of unknown function DUF29
MPDGLYERDILVWSEQQSDLLHRLARGERVNEAIDWPNVIEELRDVGRSELHACESLLLQALLHIARLWLWPESQAYRHWTGEVVGFLIGARRRFTPSMRQRIVLDDIYLDAVTQARAGDPSSPELAPHCPFSLDELLARNVDPLALAARLREPGQP